MKVTGWKCAISQNTEYNYETVNVTWVTL